MRDKTFLVALKIKISEQLSLNAFALASRSLKGAHLDHTLFVSQSRILLLINKLLFLQETAHTGFSRAEL